METTSRAHVYAYQERGTGRIKVGHSKRLAIRVRALGDGKLVAKYPHAGGNVERALHLLLSAYRITGEWFRPHPMVWETLRAVAAVVPDAWVDEDGRAPGVYLRESLRASQ